MPDETKADAPEHLDVVTTAVVYTYPGQHPHPIGTRLRLLRDHALELLEGGHAKKPEDEPDAAKAAPIAEPAVAPAGLPQPVAEPLPATPAS